MSALATRLATPHAALLRHQALDRPDWWRCRVRAPGLDAWGTVTGLISLGPTVTSYQVRLDDGITLHAWPATVGRAPDHVPNDRSGHAAGAVAHLTVINGGKSCA